METSKVAGPMLISRLVIYLTLASKWLHYFTGPRLKTSGFYSPAPESHVNQFLGSRGGLHNPQLRIRRETMNESEFQSIIAQQIKCIGAKHSLPAYLGSQLSYQPTTKEVSLALRRPHLQSAGKRWPVSNTPSSLPTPTPLLSYNIGCCQALNPCSVIMPRRQPKMGWNRRHRWNWLSASSKEITEDDDQSQTFLQTFPFYFLTTIFHF